MSERALHIVQVLIRHAEPRGIAFLLYPHERWRATAGAPYLSLPTKTSVDDRPEPFEHGTSLDAFVDALMQQKLGLADADYALEQELEGTVVEMPSPSRAVLTRYTAFPLDVWVAPAALEPLRQRIGGLWLTPAEALTRDDLSPTARAVFELVGTRERQLDERYRGDEEDERRPEAPRRLLGAVPAGPSMAALARKWLAHNRSGVRVLDREKLGRILDCGDRAFNLRVADPYLPYQMQGVGFTWSFFTHKDAQDVHVHGAPVVEIYGVLEGRLELWWKSYYDRGTSAWTHRVLNAGDWAEVDSLHCHAVRWLTEGKGVVFKAGPGPLAEVGPLGVKGKTPCRGRPCMKPAAVCALEGGGERPVLGTPGRIAPAP